MLQVVGLDSLLTTCASHAQEGVVVAASNAAVNEICVAGVTTSFGAADALLCLPVLHYHTAADACWSYTTRTACFGKYTTMTNQDILVCLVS